MNIETRKVVVLGTDDKEVLKQALKKVQNSLDYASTNGDATIIKDLNDVYSMLKVYIDNID